MATPLAEILHNIADHTETILHVLNDPGVPGDVSQRMFAHILLEEKENTTKLEEIHGAGPTLLTQKLLDHSFFIQRMLQEQAMSVDLKRELLDHFMEEHVEWRTELLGPDAPPHTGGRPGQCRSGTAGTTTDFATGLLRTRLRLHLSDQAKSVFPALPARVSIGLKRGADRRTGARRPRAVAQKG